MARYLRTLHYVALALVTGCSECGSSSGGSSGGITIQSTDGTPPTLTLGAAPQGSSQTVTVKVGGADQAMNLAAKTGFLNLIATAEDQESGVQALQIWVNTKTTTCTGNLCQASGPGLLSAPTYDNSSTKLNPGQQTTSNSTMLQALDLTAWLPQSGVAPGSTRTVTLLLHATSMNHLGGQSTTPTISLVWKEP